MSVLKAFTMSPGLKRLRAKQESFDALALVRKVEKAGYKVRRMEVIGPLIPGDQPMFVITFNPVMPSDRCPVERIIAKMGLQVEGGGTLCMVQPPDRKGDGKTKPKRRFAMSESDVSFAFRNTFGKEPADTAIDVIRHLASELEAARDKNMATIGSKLRRRRTARRRR